MAGSIANRVRILNSFREANMEIIAFDLEPVVLPKDDPTWKFALGANPATEGVVVRLATDSAEGYGYASATAHMGSIRTALMAELEHFRASVLGARADNLNAIMTMLDSRLRGAQQAKAAIDCALHDLLARSLGVPVSTLLGGLVRNRVPILRILAIKSPEEMALQAAKLVDQGYRYLKIKVHGEVDLDVARVAAIRKSVGDDVHLTIDANQSYSPKDAVTAILRMADYRIDLVEQPVRANDLEVKAFSSRPAASFSSGFPPGRFAYRGVEHEAPRPEQAVHRDHRQNRRPRPGRSNPHR
jgi:L-alanine-DL-glutamate epimerase-like enolase superfamily enzyme